MKKLVIMMLVIILASMLIPVGIASAASPSVDDVKVFQGYKETDDWLIVAVYNISGTNTSTSLCDVYSNQWSIQLLDSTSTVKAQGIIKQCGMRPASIYLSAATGDTLEWGGNYSIKIIASWGALPSASRTLVPTDWVGSNLVNLDSWAISRAKTIQTFDALTYVDTVAIYGEVLNVEGGYIFDTGIPYLSSYRPNLFLLTIEEATISYVTVNDSSTYASDLYTSPLSDVLGVPVATALDNAGDWFGISDRLMGAVLTLIGFLVIASIGSVSIGTMVILGGVMIGVFPMAIIYVLGFILVVVFVRGFFWSST
jgi:hypothetical protein